MRVRRLAAAGTAALLLPFAACSDGDSNAEPPEPTSSASPSPNETASDGPTLPTQAQGTGEAAAKAFVKFYFELISEAMITGDTDPLRTHSATTCDSCLATARNLDEIYAAGGSFNTKGWVPERLTVLDTSDSLIRFVVRVQQTRGTQLDSDGDVTTIIRPVETAMRVTVRHGAHGWVMHGMDLIR